MPRCPQNCAPPLRARWNGVTSPAPFTNCRSLGVSEQTYYKWRREYGGLKMDQAKRLKEPERENERLKKAVSELTLDKLILKEALTGKY